MGNSEEGKLIKIKRGHIETMFQFLKDCNLIITAKRSAFNLAVFDRISGYYFKCLLDGTISNEAIHDYMMQFPKPDNEM